MAFVVCFGIVNKHTQAAIKTYLKDGLNNVRPYRFLSIGFLNKQSD